MTLRGYALELHHTLTATFQTDPRSEGVEDDDDLSLIKKRRGRWRRGGLSQFREGEDATDEEEAGEFDGDDEDDDGVYGDTDDDGERPRRSRRTDKREDDEGVEEGSDIRHLRAN